MILNQQEGKLQKVEIIKELMKYSEYQEYLGIESFSDYISIPQKFACDNIDFTEKMVADQLANCASHSRWITDPRFFT